MKKPNKAKKDLCNKTDDWCFICKDGGDLIVCDHRGCLKVYHATCVGKDETLLEREERWVCDRHTCFVCCKSTKIYCFCCPNAVCGDCNSAAEFTHIKRNGGLCDECMRLTLLIEEEADYDSDGEKLDFNNLDTYECLFKEYWEIIKEREDLTLEDVYSADARLKKGKKSDESVSNVDEPKRSGRKRTIESASESDEGEVKGPRGRGKRSSNKFQEFDGWGSKPLIHFLNSIGEDTSKELSRLDVDTIICKYIQEKDLRAPGKKKTVYCDDKLYAIFRKKKINKNKMYYFLEPHFKDMVVLSDEDEKVDDHITLSGIRGVKATKACKKPRTSDLDRESQQEEVIQEVQRVQESCFAAINVDNLRLVYLRRSFLEELFKQPDTAEGKIVGSFVKTKVDPTYQLFKSSHQLLQVTEVTGLKQGSSATNNEEILLLASKLSKPINIKMLSDSDITEEECEDLRQRVKDGISKKFTVEELQEKAESLHEFITKLEMYLEKKALLNTPSEQERRLKQVPKIIAEVVSLYSGKDLKSDEKGSANSPHHS
ncbi:hypothetical protein SAY87_029770 [Trapa incisa]|uniref:Uncharacterized protein n=1 Tax=Trapa incisa TaxID=236973 RepID=A0AAN7KDA2_9MYRT|nr:hypothetical protein SAY87_029770 [Trapa incisa]